MLRHRSGTPKNVQSVQKKRSSSALLNKLPKKKSKPRNVKPGRLRRKRGAAMTTTKEVMKPLTVSAVAQALSLVSLARSLLTERARVMDARWDSPRPKAVSRLAEWTVMTVKVMIMAEKAMIIFVMES